jgi:uncharacterized membrane protein YphA (DoxX/SURF4 family)
VKVFLCQPVFLLEQAPMADASLKNTLVPLVLRLALAAIFIYHGLDKVIGAHNTWGASWATHLWQQQSLCPKEVDEKLNDMKLDADEAKNKEEIEKVRTELHRVYQASKAEPPDSVRYAAAQIAVAWGELLGGAALLLGVLTRLAAVGLLIIQVGAILTVTAAKGFSVTAGGGAEYNVALIAMCLVLILTGGGACSVDGILRRRRQGPATG